MTLWNRFAVAFAALIALASAAGCASPVEGEDVAVTRAAETASTVATTTTTGPASGAATEFPPRAVVPFGAKRAEVCAKDDGDVKKVFTDYVASKGAVVKRPPADVTQWPWNGYAYECRYCDLSNMELYIGSGGRIAIWESYAPNLLIDSTGVHVDMETVYARGARIMDHVSLEAYHVDLRCADIEPDDPERGEVITQGQSVDFSGTTGALWLRGYFNDSRFTGSEAAITLDGDGGALLDARLDGLSGTVRMSDGFFGGAVRLDGSRLTIEATNMVFDKASFTFGGAQGSVRLAGDTTFDGGDLTAPHDGFRVDLGSATVHATNAVRWPVGKGRILDSDASLAKIDLGKSGKATRGAVLVTQPGEAWPAGPLDLRGLRLSHGALPDGTDASLLTLDGASLEGVSFATTTLAHGGRAASFKGAHLSRADLAQKDVTGVDFTSADLRGARLSDVTGKARFDGARAGVLGPHVDDNDTDLPMLTSFERAELSTSTFTNAYLEYADFGFADLAEVDLTGAHLDWARFTNARLQKSGAPSTSLKKAASVFATRWDGADMRGVDLSGLDFRAAEGRRSTFERAILCGAKLTQTKLHDANLGGLLFDVDGGVRFPDGSVGPCTPGDRTGAVTTSIDGRLGTQCPNGGHVPAGDDGQCTAAQWKVTGIPSETCSDAEKRNALDDGGPCTKDCQCQSAFCAPDHTCREPS